MIVTVGSALADATTPVLPISMIKNMIFLDIINLRFGLINKNTEIYAQESFFNNFHLVYS